MSLPTGPPPTPTVAPMLRFKAQPAKLAEMAYSMKLMTSNGADKLRPRPDAMAMYYAEILKRWIKDAGQSRIIVSRWWSGAATEMEGGPDLYNGGKQ